jgi:hypothetical protein
VVPEPGRFEVGRGKLRLGRLQLRFALCCLGRYSMNLRIPRPDLVPEAGSFILEQLHGIRENLPVCRQLLLGR